jgi:hypothetical protein
MKKHTVFASIIASSLLFVACGGSNPATPTPPPAPTPTLVALRGNVSVTGGSQVANAVVTIHDGPNQGKTATTNSNGEYQFDGLTQGNSNLSAKVDPYVEVWRGVNINGTNTLDFVFAVPDCQTNNTARIKFSNRSPATRQYILWDGIRLFTLNPGETSEEIVTAAGVAHTLQFRVDGTGATACSTSSPVLSQCKSHHYSCSFPTAAVANGRPLD